jgi:outer membrane protein assembly factor BamB
MNGAYSSRAIPALGLVGALLLVALWLTPRSNPDLKPRLPGADAAPGGGAGGSNPVLAGKLASGSAATPTNFAGSWPQFRGPQRDGIAPAAGNLSRDWTSQPPRELWGLDVGEGYAGVAIRAGRVYLLDYDRDAQRSVLRCLSLADGREIWNFSYPLSIKRNHGMTRTVPTLADDYLVALDSKCNVFCLDAATGELRWSVSLRRCRNGMPGNVRWWMVTRSFWRRAAGTLCCSRWISPQANPSGKRRIPTIGK